MNNSFYLAKYAKRLAAKVQAHNELDAMVNEWFPKIRSALEPWVGQKVSLITGGKPYKLQKLIDSLNLPNDFQKQILVSFDRYSAKVTFKNCVSIPDDSYQSAETVVYLGDMQMQNGLVLGDLRYTFTPYKTDYTVEKVILARQQVEDAKKALSDALSALHPFGEHDNN